jgi:hypothetical protein
MFRNCTSEFNKRKCRSSSLAIPIGNETLYYRHFADELLAVAQDDNDLEYVAGKIQEECEARGLTSSFTNNL